MELLELSEMEIDFSTFQVRLSVAEKKALHAAYHMSENGLDQLDAAEVPEPSCVMEVDDSQTGFHFVQDICNERGHTTSRKKYVVRDSRAAVHHYNDEGKTMTTEVFRLVDGQWTRNLWRNPEVVREPENR
jgi:hypothetical protein